MQQTQQYQSDLVTNPSGIPGLSDGSGNYAGFGKNDTEYTDIALGTIGTVVDDVLQAFQAKDFADQHLKNLQNGVVVKIANVAVDPERITVDYASGTITVKLLAADSGKKVTGTYKAVHPGTPSYLDFKGVVSSMGVLLHK